MDIRKVTDNFTVSGQISYEDIDTLHQLGVKTIIVNRPNGEGPDQLDFVEVEQKANALGLKAIYLPVTSGAVTDTDAKKFGELLVANPTPVHAYCRSGMRSITLWAISQNQAGTAFSAIVNMIDHTGYDISGLASRLSTEAEQDQEMPSYDVIIVGAGAAGIAAASSIKKRAPGLSIAIVDPADFHYYQPGWTLVGAGIFTQEQTKRMMGSLIPKGIKWIKSAVAQFLPEVNQVLLEGCRPLAYKQLVVAAGLKLNWEGIEGLTDTLGKNGVTSNYRYDLAPYTWELVKNMTSGVALFTQPPMPIKCAGAPQKVMYLSADNWFRNQKIKDIDVRFYNTGPGLFGVKEYVPALMKYIDKYSISLNFQHQLVKVDGPAKKAYFKNVAEGASDSLVEVNFDILHVCPPQQAPDFIRNSPLADAAGWVDVNSETLQHTHFENVWSLGDVMNAPNAKTAAAARMQAPVVAHNLVNAINKLTSTSKYNGYGSCPLTVEKGKIVLAEFGYGGKLLPSFPNWLINGTQPSRMAWLLKEKILPAVYWSAMLKGREWMIEPIIEDVHQ